MNAKELILLERGEYAMVVDTGVDAWMCGECGRPHQHQSNAEACCRCNNHRSTGCRNKRGANSVWCDGCHRSRMASIVEQRRFRNESLPIVSYAGEPVWCEEVDRYWPDLDSASDWLLDEYDSWEELVAARVVLQPCQEVKATFRDLLEVIDEGWNEDLPDEVEPYELKGDLHDLVATVQSLVQAKAPTYWTPLPQRLDVAGWLPEAFERRNGA